MKFDNTTQQLFKVVATEGGPEAAREVCAISRYAGEEEILRAVLALERRNFTKSDAWTGSYSCRPGYSVHDAMALR